jgi:hypothetical protein
MPFGAVQKFQIEIKSLNYEEKWFNLETFI